MGKIKKWLVVLIVLVLLAFLGFKIFESKIGSVSIPSENKAEIKNILDGEEMEGLNLPEGFKMMVFARDLSGARVMEFDERGRMLVSRTKEGKISILENPNENGFYQSQRILIDKLKNPHGMAFKCSSDTEKCELYVAESDALLRFDYDKDKGMVSNKTKLTDISYSSSDNHFTRSLLFLPYPEENTLLISVGSSCNVCNEDEDQYAKILAYDLKSGELSEYATGLRNSVFMTMSYIDGRIFATEMGRDGLGDDTPPDEINIIQKGKDYGWPICYGDNIHDSQFDKNTYIRNPCSSPLKTPSFIDLQAHSAPLGLAFVPEEGWREDYWYNLLVAYHGSWNRKEPTGYKIARIKLDAKGKYLGTEDFITGWLTKDGKKIGRPVDIKLFPGGVGYISDDMAGVIYKFFPTEEAR